MPFEMLYRASFAFWLLNYVRALPEASFVLDLAAPLADVRAVFADHTGIDLEFGTSPAPPAKELLFHRNHKRPAAAAIREIHAIATAALAPFVTEAALRHLVPWIDRAGASAERDLNGQVTILPEPSLAHAAGLFLHAAHRWMKSQPGVSGPIATYSRASRGSLPKQVHISQGG
jgi:hypothetical protein